MRLLVLLSVFLFAFQQINAQTYQRIFRSATDRNTNTIDAVQTSNGTTFVLSEFKETMDERKGLMLTKHNLKGDNEWSREFFLPDSIQIERFGEMVYNTNDSIAFTCVTNQNAGFGRILIKGNNQGIVDWSIALGGLTQDTTMIRPTSLDESPFGGFYSATSETISDTIQSMVLSHIDGNGNITWSNSYEPMDTINSELESTFMDFSLEADSTLLTTGYISRGSSKGFYLSRFDSLSNSLWSKAYFLEGASNTAPLDMVVLSDSSIVVVGVYEFISIKGFVSRISKSGDVMWTKYLQQEAGSPFEQVSLAEVTQGNNGDIVVAGVCSSLLGGKFGMISTSFDLDGNPQWSHAFNRQSVRLIDPNVTADLPPHLKYNNYGNLIAASDNGYALVNSSIDLFALMQEHPLLIKMDDIGQAFCEDTISLPLFDISVITDTLIWNALDTGYVAQEIEVTHAEYNGISAPILGIEEVVVCPNLPIDTILDASIVNAVAYQWSTGDTTAILNVTEEGDYPVTVTLDTEVCFTLCDTAKVSTYDSLTAFIQNVDPALWCSDRILGLDVLAEGGLKEYSYEWSNGDTDGNITFIDSVDVNTQFIVTVTDECGQTASVSIIVGDDNANIPLPESASVQFNESVYCNSDEDNRIYQLDLFVTGSPYDESTIVWSNGATGVTSVDVNGPGLYSVKLRDDCNYEIYDTIEFDVPVAAQIDLELIESTCFEDIQLNIISGDIEENTIQWSSGQSNITTLENIDEYGITYYVTVTDDCNYTIVDSIFVDAALEPVPPVITTSQSQSACGSLISINVVSGSLEGATYDWGGAPCQGPNCEINALADGSFISPVALTITDQCGFIVTEVIEIDPSFSPIPQEVTLNKDYDCVSNLITLSITGPSVTDESTIIWSSGQNTIATETYNVIVNTPGIYSAAFIGGQCNLNVQGSIEVFEEDFIDPSLDIVLDTTNFCENGFVTLTAVSNTELISTNWVNISTSETIEVEKDTMSQLFVLQAQVEGCDSTLTKSIIIDSTAFSKCGGCIAFPNIFFPNIRNLDPTGPTITLDKKFKGVLLPCCSEDNIEDFELFVYNGYGNLLFESNDPTEGWDGIVEGDIMPSGVYMWYASWAVDGISYNKKGDLTLMR